MEETTSVSIKTPVQGFRILYMEETKASSLTWTNFKDWRWVLIESSLLVACGRQQIFENNWDLTYFGVCTTQLYW
jgi:hypothetical protein